jgi:hypothetical protein
MIHEKNMKSKISCQTLFKCCARNILTVLTETRADNTFNKGGRGESCTLVLCSFTTVMSCMDLSVRIVTKSPKGERLLIFSISLERLFVPKLPN